jgi:hypothetical protein
MLATLTVDWGLVGTIVAFYALGVVLLVALMLWISRPRPQRVDTRPLAPVIQFDLSRRRGHRHFARRGGGAA